MIRRHAVSAAVCASILAVYLVSLSIPQPAVRTSFEGGTEKLVYYLASGDAQRFDLGTVIALPMERTEKPVCIRNATMHLSGGGLDIARSTPKSGVSIGTLPGSRAYLEGKDSRSVHWTNGDYVLLLGGAVEGVDACRGSGRVRLPISGHVMIGSETDDARSLLTSGKLRIYGQVRPNWVSFLHSGNVEQTAVLFEAKQVELPKGIRVGSFVPRSFADKEGQRGGPADLASPVVKGAIEIMLGASEDQGAAEGERDVFGDPLSVFFQTSGDALYVWSEGASMADSPDRFVMTLSARLGGDPYFQWLISISSASALVISLWAGLWALRKR